MNIGAEKMYVRALRGYEKALGAEHMSALNTVNSLGNLYKDQGKMAEAEELYVRALRGKGEGVREWSTRRCLRRSTISATSTKSRARWRRRRSCMCGRCEDTRRQWEWIIQEREESLAT
jgi:tetratricopeptide (TPR) repeat protein